MKSFAALAGEEDRLAVGRPAQHEVVGRVDGEPLDLAAGRGDHDRRRGRPRGRWRRRSSLPSGENRGTRSRALFDGEADDLRAVLAGGPDVAQVAEGDLAVVVVRRANQLRLTCAGGRGDRETKGSSNQSVAGHGGELIYERD